MRWIPLVLLLAACRPDPAPVDGPSAGTAETTLMKDDAPLPFDTARWRERDGARYPWRPRMVDDVLYNDTVRALSPAALRALLGEPDREADGHWYYRIEQDRVGGFWTVRQRTLVVKTIGDSAIAWIKLHE